MHVTLLSNGHGEDTVGATLAEQLLELEPTLELGAFPTVGSGRAYERVNIPILGPRRELPSGGFTAHTLGALSADLRAGFLPMTAAQLSALRALQTDLLVVVGDIYALLLSSAVRTQGRFYLQTLVSSYHQLSTCAAPRSPLNRYFMERFTLPERLLMRRLVRHSYVRDAPTAALLSRYQLPVSALGNPMLDVLTPSRALDLTPPPLPPVVALLPGTRSYAAQALTQMVQALTHWPAATGLVAWAGAQLPHLPGWRLESLGPSVWQLQQIGARSHRPRVLLLTGHFAEVLHASQLALGTSGTANEQAAALGRPLVAFALPPLYTPAFVANQQRLLGAALHVCQAAPENLPAELAAALRHLWETPARYEAASQAGRRRMGAAGGGRAIAYDILERVRTTTSSLRFD